MTRPCCDIRGQGKLVKMACLPQLRVKQQREYQIALWVLGSMNTVFMENRTELASNTLVQEQLRFSNSFTAMSLDLLRLHLLEDPGIMYRSQMIFGDIVEFILLKVNQMYLRNFENLRFWLKTNWAGKLRSFIQITEVNSVQISSNNFVWIMVLQCRRRLHIHLNRMGQPKD